LDDDGFLDKHLKAIAAALADRLRPLGGLPDAHLAEVQHVAQQEGVDSDELWEYFAFEFEKGTLNRAIRLAQEHPLVITDGRHWTQFELLVAGTAYWLSRLNPNGELYLPGPTVDKALSASPGRTNTATANLRTRARILEKVGERKRSNIYRFVGQALVKVPEDAPDIKASPPTAAKPEPGPAPAKPAAAPPLAAKPTAFPWIAKWHAKSQAVGDDQLPPELPRGTLAARLYKFGMVATGDDFTLPEEHAAKVFRVTRDELVSAANYLIRREWFVVTKKKTQDTLVRLKLGDGPPPLPPEPEPEPARPPGPPAQSRPVFKVGRSLRDKLAGL
jgi:hypothetical protein